MKKEMTMPILPLPEKHELEIEISELLKPGDIKQTARYVQRDASLVSRVLSPNPNHNNNVVYFFLQFLWAFDNIRRPLGDAVINIVLREREKWLAEDVVLAEHPATMNRQIGEELFEAMEYEMKDAEIDDQINQWNDVKIRVNAKLNALTAKRAVQRFGGPIRDNVRELGSDLVHKAKAS